MSDAPLSYGVIMGDWDGQLGGGHRGGRRLIRSHGGQQARAARRIARLHGWIWALSIACAVLAFLAFG